MQFKADEKKHFHDYVKSLAGDDLQFVIRTLINGINQRTKASETATSPVLVLSESYINKVGAVAHTR
jgi:hypothetical protein